MTAAAAPRVSESGGADADLQPGPFVSYSRADQEFVRNLHDALRRRGRDTWVDWEGIYPTEEWMQKIHAAIDAAQAFVFVITPESVVSAVCGQEIDHAVAQSKRLIPIVARDVDAGSVHPALAKLNWLYLRQGDDFEHKVDELIAAMDIDLDWLRSHTRLLVRAEEWHKRGRDTSLLLRGNDLRGAERWLLEAGRDTERAPTALQTQFIVASRQAETRRRNVQRAIAVAGSIVLCLLSIYSWLQKGIAERQRDDAVSRQLAIRASSLGDDQFVSRLLVSALATRYSHTAEADASLARALLPGAALQTMLWNESRSDPFDCISFHRDGNFVAGSNTHGVAVWRIAGGAMEAFYPSEDGVDCVAFGPRDDLLAIADEGRILLWQWRTDQLRTLGPEPNGMSTQSAFSADGASVFVASGGRLTKWDLEKASSRTVLELQDAADVKFVFSADGTRLVSAGTGQPIIVWDLVAETRMMEFEGPTGAGFKLAVSANGTTLAAGLHSVMVWDLDASAARIVNELSDVTVKSLAFSPDGATLAVGVVGGEVRQWNFRKRSQRWPLRGPEYGAGRLAFSPDGGLLAASGETGSIWLWRPSQQHDHILQEHAAVELLGEVISADGRMVALRRGQGPVLWDPSGARQALELVDLPSQPLMLRISPKGNRLAVLDGERRIGVWDTDTGQPMQRAFAVRSPPERIDIDARGAMLAAVDIDGGLSVWDLRTGDSEAAWSRDAAATGHTRSVAFSADGMRLASGGLEGSIHLWSAERGQDQFQLQNGEGNVLALAFSADGARLAASKGSVIVVWDLQERAVRRHLRGHDSSVTSLAFAPDGKHLASGSLDKSVILWNPSTGEALIRLIDQHNPVEVFGVAFGGQGTTLATRTRANSVKLWNLDSRSWTKRACSIVNRNLTREEWETYLPGESYRAACPDLPTPRVP